MRNDDATTTHCDGKAQRAGPAAEEWRVGAKERDAFLEARTRAADERIALERRARAVDRRVRLARRRQRRQRAAEAIARRRSAELALLERRQLHQLARQRACENPPPSRETSETNSEAGDESSGRPTVERVFL